MANAACTLTLQMRVNPVWLLAFRAALALRCWPAASWLARHPIVKVVR